MDNQPEALRLAEKLTFGQANFYAESSLWFDNDLCENVGKAAAELRRLHAENERLRAAAYAVVERWDSPLWKDLPHTGNYIDALRAALKEQQ